jgi:hypothetical protein
MSGSLSSGVDDGDGVIDYAWEYHVLGMDSVP